MTATEGLLVPPGHGRVVQSAAQRVTFKVTGTHSRTASTFEVEVPPGFDVGNFNVFTIRWLSGSVQWLVNGAVVRTTADAVPNDPMSLSLNFWAPDPSWPSAYSSALQPTATAAAGST